MFGSVFDEPSGLPSPRSYDQKIKLQEGSKPPYVRPYRYLYYQKGKIKHLVAKMLTSGIIRAFKVPPILH